MDRRLGILAIVCAGALLSLAPRVRAQSAGAEVIEPADTTAPATPNSPATPDSTTVPPAANSDESKSPDGQPAQATQAPLDAPKSSRPVTRMPITVNEPDFKATAIFPETPVPKLDQDTRAPKTVAKPKQQRREFSVPPEEGVAEPITPADDKTEAAAKEKEKEEISPALAKVIARERSGKKLREIVPQYQDIVATEPQNAEAHYRLGLVMAKTGDLKVALQELETALKLKPGNNKFRCDYGLIAIQAGWVEKALDACRTAAQTSPAVARYQSALGDVLVAVGDVTNAVDAYTRAVNLEPQNAEYLHNLGKAFMLGRAFKRAGEVLDEAIRLKPENSTYYCTRGLAFESDKAFKEAIRSYMIAVKLDKDNPYAHYLLASIYSDPVDPTYTNSFEAMDHAQKAVKLTESKNPLYLMGLARAQRLAHDYGGAVLTGLKALELQPRDDWRQEVAEFERLKNEGHDMK